MFEKRKLQKIYYFMLRKSAFDCTIHSSKNCFNIGDPNPNKLMYTPNPEKQNVDEQQNINIKQNKLLFK